MNLLKSDGDSDPGQHCMDHDGSDRQGSSRNSAEPEDDLQESGRDGDGTGGAPPEGAYQFCYYDGQSGRRTADLKG